MMTAHVVAAVGETTSLKNQLSSLKNDYDRLCERGAESQVRAQQAEERVAEVEAECAVMRQAWVELMVAIAGPTVTTSTLAEWTAKHGDFLGTLKTAGKAMLEELCVLRERAAEFCVACEWCGRSICDTSCPGPPPDRRRWSIVAIDPDGSVGLVPAQNEEDSAPDPNSPGERCPLFSTPNAARAGIARRTRLEVRELPKREKT